MIGCEDKVKGIDETWLLTKSRCAVIEGILGRVGSGKTYMMVARALKLIGKRPIYSNMSTPPGDPWFIHFDDWQDLIGIRNALVLIDEVGLWFSARDYRSFPKDVGSFFAQSRKHGADLWYTAQNDAMVDAFLRRQTATYWDCARYGPFIIAKGSDPADPGHKCFGKRWFRLKPEVYNRYDTYEILGFADGSGQGGRGARGIEKDKARIREVIQNALVRVGSHFGGGYRSATEDDVLRGRKILRFVKGRLQEVNTDDLVIWRHEPGETDSARAGAAGEASTPERRCPVCGCVAPSTAPEGRVYAGGDSNGVRDTHGVNGLSAGRLLGGTPGSGTTR